MRRVETRAGLDHEVAILRHRDRESGVEAAKAARRTRVRVAWRGTDGRGTTRYRRTSPNWCAPPRLMIAWNRLQQIVS
jgi:hypothetical protein